MPFIMQLIGFIGAFLLLLAFYLVSKKQLLPSAKRYHGLNAAGSLMIVFNTYYLDAYGVLILNLAWFAIAASGLFKAQSSK